MKKLVDHMQQKAIAIYSTIVPIIILGWGICLTTSLTWQIIFGTSIAIIVAAAVMIAKSKENSDAKIVKITLVGLLTTILTICVHVLISQNLLPTLGSAFLGYALTACAGLGMLAKKQCNPNYEKFIIMLGTTFLASTGICCYFDIANTLISNIPHAVRVLANIICEVGIVSFILIIGTFTVLLARATKNSKNALPKTIAFFGTIALLALFLIIGGQWLTNLWGATLALWFIKLAGVIILSSIVLVILLSICYAFKESKK